VFPARRVLVDLSGSACELGEGDDAGLRLRRARAGAGKRSTRTGSSPHLRSTEILGAASDAHLHFSSE
jgi:hypothetical protein